MGTAAKPEAEKAPPVHRVLYMNDHPVMSTAADDKNADEDFAAFRLDAITKARHGGAVRPEFREAKESGGKEIS